MTGGLLKLNNRYSAERIACLLIFAIVGNLSHAAALTESFEGRDMLVHVPKALPAAGTRALVIVLHGGMGNASRIEGGRSENGLNLDQVADDNGFLVAYLNGTRAARMLGSQALAWNAGGGCCGLPARSDVDDLHYIDGAARHLAAEYGIDPHRFYVMGHSNGGIMSQRLICEPSVFSAAISVSGPLNLPQSSCPGAAGKKIMSIHGTADLEVPVAGGRGQGVSGVAFASEATSSQVMKNSGAQYDLVLVNGAPHMLNQIDESLKRESGASIAETAVNYFGLSSGR
jgi:polyhydroxybutyrate depolymerase